MNDPIIIIRPFHEAELPALHSMICDTIDASYSTAYPPRAVDFFKEHHSETRIAERSRKGEVIVLIAEQDGSILATGSLVGSEIVGVFVRLDHQGRGFGKIIMDRLEGMATAKGLSEVGLSISLPSRMFYEHLGYEVHAERAIDVGEGQCLKYWQGRKALTS
ncbi:MAG: GNAT family N-acetyltransferase [Syntrophales bacterium]